jgi:lipoprotein-anchoring transpeptidase ErfK/SrfK
MYLPLMEAVPDQAFAFAPAPALARSDRVSVKDSYGPGTIVIRTRERRLYYFVGAGEAIRYPVDVGRAGNPAVTAGSVERSAIRECDNAEKDHAFPAWSRRRAASGGGCILVMRPNRHL